MFVVGIFAGCLVAGASGLLSKPVPRPLPRDPPPPAPRDEDAQFEEYLAECRLFATERDPPDWTRADIACGHALDIDPISAEANQLAKLIRFEKACLDLIDLGDTAAERMQPDEALREFAQVDARCRNYPHAVRKMREATETVTRREASACISNVEQGLFLAALSHCNRYMHFACPDLKPEELNPPAKARLALYPGKLKPGDWRPANTAYLNFLRARAQVEPTAVPFRCEDLIDGAPSAPAVPGDPQGGQILHGLEDRFGDPELEAAVYLYFQGKLSEAVAKLKGRRGAADAELVRALATAARLYPRAEALLQAGKPQEAAGPVGEVLMADVKVMADLVDTYPSAVRRNLERDMAQACYSRGKSLADRQDYAGACKVWKLGQSVDRGNAELLRMLGSLCSPRASQAIDGARTCADLDRAADYAVDGDGLISQVMTMRSVLNCR